MNVEEQLANIKKHMNGMKGMHDHWSSKRQAFYTFFEELLTNSLPVESLLNVGVGPGNPSFWPKILSLFLPTITYFENLEIDEEIVKKHMDANSRYLSNIQLGDVKNIDEIYSDNSFDMIFWNQGPEHIYREEWKDTFEKLKKVASKVIFMHCPWGNGYDYDQWHYSKSVQRGEFEKFGFKELVHGKKNTKDGGIIAYKIL